MPSTNHQGAFAKPLAYDVSQAGLACDLPWGQCNAWLAEELLDNGVFEENVSEDWISKVDGMGLVVAGSRCLRGMVKGLVYAYVKCEPKLGWEIPMSSTLW